MIATMPVTPTMITMSIRAMVLSINPRCTLQPSIGSSCSIVSVRSVLWMEASYPVIDYLLASGCLYAC